MNRSFDTMVRIALAMYVGLTLVWVTKVVHGRVFLAPVAACPTGVGGQLEAERGRSGSHPAQDSPAQAS